MPQQINLCAPLERPGAQSFTARTMAQALLVFVVLGGVLSGVWLWNLRQAATAYSATLADQARDLQGLKTALQEARASAAPADAALATQLQDKRRELARRERLLADLQDGLFAPGEGHSARLQLLSRSIPEVVWLSDVKAQRGRMEMRGLTLEPAALNDWMARLAQSPLMRGLQLSTVQVESTANAASASPQGAGSRPTWAFTLVSEWPALAPANGGAP